MSAPRAGDTPTPRPASRRSRRPWWMLGALVLAAVLAGCAGLPHNSGVVAEQAISSSPVLQPPNVFPNPPRPGEGPRQIVGDFLKANSSPDEDYRVARLYLTGAANNAWNPGGQPTTITTGEQDYDIIEPYHGPVEASASAIATLDSGGDLVSLPHHEGIQAGFRLSKVGGQWRISHLPSNFGSWVSLVDFNRLYQPRQVYFADTATRTLVPATRWYLSVGGEATALARSALGRVPSWMTGMPHPTLPSGTHLEVDAVPVDENGVATVDLSHQALQADSTTRRAIWAAIMATLSQLPKVRNVQLTVGGRPLAVGKNLTGVTTPSALGYHDVVPSDSEVIIRNGDQLQWSGPTQVPGELGIRRPPSSPKAPLPTLSSTWQLVAASAGGRQLAAVSRNRASLGRWVHGHLTVQSFGTDLTRPTFTRMDELWVAGRPQSANSEASNHTSDTVWVIDAALPPAQAQPQAVYTPWLGSAQVLAMKASPEGDRMAMILRTSGSTQLVLSGIVRNPSGQAVALTAPQREGQPVTGLTDVTWLDPVTLGVLGVVPSSPTPQPVIVPLGGLVTPMGPARGARLIVGQGTGLSKVYVTTDNGVVLERSGQSWRRLTSGSAVIVPGT